MRPNESTTLTRTGAAFFAFALALPCEYFVMILWPFGSGIVLPAACTYLVFRCFPQEEPLRCVGTVATSFALWFVFLAPRVNGDSGTSGWVYAVCAAFVWLFALPFCLLGAGIAENDIQRKKGA